MYEGGKTYQGARINYQRGILAYSKDLPHIHSGGKTYQALQLIPKGFQALSCTKIQGSILVGDLFTKIHP